MADEQVLEVEQKVETEISTNDKMANALMDSWFNDGVPKAEIPNETIVSKEETATTDVTETKDEEEILDPKDWLKREFDIEDVQVIKNEREELKKLKEKGSSFEFKNDDSKKIAEYINEGKIDDLYNFLDTQKRVSKLATADVSDKNIAAELVKFGIQKDNPNLTQDDVEFIFNKKFSAPKEPVQRGDELDEEFSERHSEWEQAKANTERELIIEAKMAQPKMAQFKTELVLPQIQKENTQTEAQPSQEDLDRFAKEKDSFLQSAQKSIESFNGFTVQVKDKDVDYKSSYVPSPEEKAVISNKLQEFANSGFNSNVLFLDKWLNKDNTINVNQMTEDLSRIYFGKNSDQKLATDSANKRIEAYIKEKKQIDVSKTETAGRFVPTETTKDEVLTNAWLSV